MNSPTALQGLRILDFTRVLAGPFCTMLLGDFGADVIKIERPVLGDDTREWGPPYAGDSGLSAYFISVNRNKRSLTLNLKEAEGRELAHRLALQSDVLIENFKVGQMKSYGLDFEKLHAEHPALIYCSITGYGQDGLYQDRPGYDYVIQGQSGLMSITGEPDGQPYKVGVAISDVLTGLFAVNAMLTALYHRTQTGEGQYIDISLLDSQVAALVNVVSNYLVSQKAPVRYGNAHANIVPYEAFESADGSFILAVGNDRQFRQCCDLIGRADLASDERFASNPARVQNRDALVKILQDIFREKSSVEWVSAFLKVGVPAGEINDIPSMINDAHIQARGLVQPVTLHDGTPVDLLAPTSRLSATPARIDAPPPLLGQHTDEILREVLNLDSDTINDYKERNII
jgi:formyl-CoA transferase